jgi:hypothetical protein
VVADSHHFDEDPDQHLSENLDPDPYDSDPDPQPWVKNTGSRRIKAILVNDDQNPKNESYGKLQGCYSETGFHIGMDRNFVCLWRRHNYN